MHTTRIIDTKEFKTCTRYEILHGESETYHKVSVKNGKLVKSVGLSNLLKFVTEGEILDLVRAFWRAPVEDESPCDHDERLCAEDRSISEMLLAFKQDYDLVHHQILSSPKLKQHIDYSTKIFQSLNLIIKAFNTYGESIFNSVTTKLIKDAFRYDCPMYKQNNKLKNAIFKLEFAIALKGHEAVNKWISIRYKEEIRYKNRAPEPRAPEPMRYMDGV